MVHKLTFSLVSIVVLIGISSCNSKSNSGAKTEIDSIAEYDEIDSNLLKKGVLGKLDYAIVNLKNSDEFIKILSKQTNLYDDAILNSIKKRNEYESSKAKALNLGVYGADLNYIIHFNQIQNSFKYLICAKQLADQIGVSMAFDKTAVDKFNGNVDQKDTLINIVSSAYDIIKKYLRNGDQFLVAGMVMSGSWIENMHLTFLLIDKCENEQDKTTLLLGIVAQKEYLNNLISLLNDLNEQKDPTVQKLTESFKSIYDVLLKMPNTKPSKTELVGLKNAIETLRNAVVDVK